MHGFLEEVAADILAKYNDISKICIIFPNKRSGLFFRKYLGRAINQTSIAPNIYTIEKVWSFFSGLRVPDKLTLLFELFDSFKAVFNSEKLNNYHITNSFDTFFSTGENLLSDFNEIDNYLVDIKQLCFNIRDLAAIDSDYEYLTDEQREAIKLFWKNFSSESLSVDKKRLIELWTLLPDVYHHFTNSLATKKLAYNGLVNKIVYLKSKNSQLNLSKFDTYIFVGFNALNQAEKGIFKYMTQQNKARFYWDVDSYYLADNRQEAGMFLRENITLFKNELSAKAPSNIKNNPKTIDLIGIPQNIGQAKALNKIFTDLNLEQAPESDLENTAVILTDEHLLFPVLYAIPDYIKKLNITMGYPFKQTPLYALLLLFLKLQKLTNNKSAVKNRKYYYKDVLAILEHPVLGKSSKTLLEQVRLTIKQLKLVYISESFFAEYKNPLLNCIFVPQNTTDSSENLITHVLQFLAMLFSLNNKQGITKHDIENEYIYGIYVELKRLRELLNDYETKFTITNEIIVKFIKQLMLNLKIPFDGEPVNGIQIIGIMETRNLDFKNVILLNMNEGVFPVKSSKSTFISENMRFAFGLPLLRYQDAIFAYFFYRLLQRATHVKILYNTVTSNTLSAEISRFVNQLENESGLTINRYSYTYDLKPMYEKVIEINKDSSIKSILQKYLYQNNNAPEKQLSNSAIITYLKCKLQFYFKYIAQLKPVKTFDEELQADAIGEILHKTMEQLYTQASLNATVLTSEIIKNLHNRIDETLLNAFKTYFSVPANKPFELTGANIIINEVIKNYIENILKYDQLYAPFSIVSLELQYGYTSKFNIQLNNQISAVNLWGIFDRIDIKENIMRVVDYKTGKANNSIKDLSLLFEKDGTKITEYSAIFQMLYYTLILKNTTKYSRNKFKPALYTIRDIYKPDFSPSIFLKPDRNFRTEVDELNIDDYLSIFSEQLKILIEEIFNQDISFSQTDNLKNCEYCSYKSICNR